MSGLQTASGHPPTRPVETRPLARYDALIPA